jgi:hypothetical protein
MAPRKSTDTMSIAELIKQRDQIQDAIKAARTKRKNNFKSAMAALAENELTGEDSLTGFDVEAVIRFPPEHFIHSGSKPLIMNGIF